MGKNKSEITILSNEERWRKFFKVSERMWFKIKHMKKIELDEKSSKLSEWDIIEIRQIIKVIRSWEVEDREIERFFIT